MDGHWTRALCLALALASGQAGAWSLEGHRTIGAVADIVLEKTPVAKKRVQAILDGRTLEEVAIWPDCAKNYAPCGRGPSEEELEYARRNPRHNFFHQTAVPLQQAGYVAGTAGTQPDDLVPVLRHAIAVLRDDAQAGPANLTRKEAVWLLVHLVGEIHQPLHVGEAYFDRDCRNPVWDPLESTCRHASLSIL